MKNELTLKIVISIILLVFTGFRIYYKYKTETVAVEHKIKSREILLRQRVIEIQNVDNNINEFEPQLVSTDTLFMQSKQPAKNVLRY